MPASHSIGRILAGMVGGAIGFCIGPVTGSMLVGMFSGPSETPAAAEAGRFCGMAVGGIGGAMLGSYLAGHPIVAKWVLGMGALIGGIAFLVGFVGPIILSPDSPQGPLLGIFVTGPLGFIIGIILGLVIGITAETGTRVMREPEYKRKATS